MKTKKSDVKKLLKGLEISSADRKDFSKVLSLMNDHPESMDRIEPPPGYEEHLLSALRQKLPPEFKAQAARNKKVKISIFESWVASFKRPMVGWSTAFALAAIGVISVVGVDKFHDRQLQVLSNNDVLATTAKRADHQELQRWLASVGDVSVYGMGEAEFLTRDAGKMKKVLDRVERELSNKL